MSDSQQSINVEEMIEEYEVRKRTFTGKMALLVSGFAILASLYHIFALTLKATSVTELRTLHLMFGLILIALIYPGFSKSKKVTIFDILLVIFTLAFSIYVLFQGHAFVLRAGFNPTTEDIVFGVLAVITILIATRRVIGWPLVIVTLVLFFYAKFGSLFPGILMGRDYSFSRIISYLFNIDGIYGIPIGVSSTYVVLFIIFGAFLKNSGAGDLYTDFANGIAGRKRGGPAKVAVISSALFGTISGSGIANVVTTGSVTIPLMKKSGFQSKVAGAVEAVASSGGQIMPPIMGAGAFLMAEMIGVPYADIMLAAAIPAILYFANVFLMVDLYAGKRGLAGLSASELPNIKDVIRNKGHLIIPLIVLLYLLIIEGSSPIKAAFYSIVSCVIVAFIRKSTRMNLEKILTSIKDGMIGSLEVIAACACAGIIMGLLTLTGLGLKISTIITSVSNSNLFLALLLTAIIVVILSMGLPATACYILSAAVMAPALTKMGISELQAHMFIFYYACLSGITPPVALAAYPAAAIANTNPVQVSFESFKLGIIGFIMPFLFVYAPEVLLIGSVPGIIFAAISSLAGVYAIAMAFQGWNRKTIHPAIRIMLFIGGLMMFVSDIRNVLIGLAIIVIGLVVNAFIVKNKEQSKREEPV